MTTRSIIAGGSIIGESDIVKFRKRQETVIAVEDCDCIQIERFNFLDLLKNFPEIEKEVLEIAEEKDKILEPFLEERRKLEAEERNRVTIFTNFQQNLVQTS